MNGKETRTNCFESNKTIFPFVIKLDSKNEKIEQFLHLSLKWIWFVNKISAAQPSFQPEIIFHSSRELEQFQFAIEVSQLSYRLLLSGWNG